MPIDTQYTSAEIPEAFPGTCAQGDDSVYVKIQKESEFSADRDFSVLSLVRVEAPLVSGIVGNWSVVQDKR